MKSSRFWLFVYLSSVALIGSTAVGAPSKENKLSATPVKKTRPQIVKSVDDDLPVHTTDILDKHKDGDWLPALPKDPHLFREEMELPKRSKAELDAIEQEFKL